MLRCKPIVFENDNYNISFRSVIFNNIIPISCLLFAYNATCFTNLNTLLFCQKHKNITKPNNYDTQVGFDRNVLSISMQSISLKDSIDHFKGWLTDYNVKSIFWTSPIISNTALITLMQRKCFQSLQTVIITGKEIECRFYRKELVVFPLSFPKVAEGSKHQNEWLTYF